MAVTSRIGLGLNWSSQQTPKASYRELIFNDVPTFILLTEVLPG
jgi:hypothetical protein